MHRLGESAADQLRGHLEQGISDRHTRPVLEGRGACRSKVLQHPMPSCQEELLRLTDLLR